MHAAHCAVEVRDFTGHLEYERAFRDDCGRIVAKLAECVRIAKHAFQTLEFRS